ncbi:hypothetical protein ACEQ8H_006062 [Pleosporales sp. CAS-2024a]
MTRRHTPIFRLDTRFQYATVAFMACYLLTMLLIRARMKHYSKAFHFSYALTISTGILSFIVNRDEFADSIRTTFLEMWFTATMHVCAQYCYDNSNPTLHFISFLGLAIVPGLALVHFPSMSPLDILPLYVATIALATLAFRALLKLGKRAEPLRDEECEMDPIVLQASRPCSVGELGVFGSA